MNLPDRFEILIITLSDRAHRGEYEDLSGPAVKKRVSGYFNSLGWTFGMTAKGTLNTAESVPSMAIRAISLELTAAASNSKKNAAMARITITVANSPQFVNGFDEPEYSAGTTKAATHTARISSRNKRLFVTSFHWKARISRSKDTRVHKLGHRSRR